MFESLAEAVEGLEVPADPVALASVWGLVDRLTAKATVAAAVFDEHGLWEVGGATSLTGWLRHRTGMSGRDAVMTAKRLRTAPVTATAWVEGDLSGGQVAVVVANVNDTRAELWAAQGPCRRYPPDWSFHRSVEVEVPRGSRTRPFR